MATDGASVGGRLRVARAWISEHASDIQVGSPTVIEGTAGIQIRRGGEPNDGLVPAHTAG